jgi:hypothetical protein
VGERGGDREAVEERLPWRRVLGRMQQQPLMAARIRLHSTQERLQLGRECVLRRLLDRRDTHRSTASSASAEPNPGLAVDGYLPTWIWSRWARNTHAWSARRCR